MPSGLGVLAALGALATSQHAPIAEEQAAPVIDRTFPVEVKLTEVTPDGHVRPLAGQVAWAVAVSRGMGPHGANDDTVGRWRTVSDLSGRAVFTDVGFIDKASYQVIVPFQGVTYRTEEFGSNGQPVELRVYHVRPEPTDLTLSALWKVELAESFLRVSQLVKVQNPTLTTFDYVHSPKGLRLPTLSFVAFDRILTSRVFPPGDTHGGQPPSTGQGRLVGEDGAIVYRGPVLPGNALYFEFSYNLPYDDETARLGTVSDLPLSEAMLTLVWSDRVHPRFHLERPHRVFRGEEDGLQRADLVVQGRTEAGAPIVLSLDRLAAQSHLPQHAAKVGAVAAFALFGVLVAGAVRRRKASPPG